MLFLFNSFISSVFNNDKDTKTIVNCLIVQTLLPIDDLAVLTDEA